MTRIRLTLFLLLASLATVARADDATDLADLPLFAGDETLAIEIEGPLKMLVRERSKTDYYDGVIRVVHADGSKQEVDLKFRARGNYRHRKSTCGFPPVRLNVDRDDTAGTILAGQNILKLVTHCRLRSDRYEALVLKEYLAYKILQVHTPISFRVRLMRITWIDSGGDYKDDERYGFVIEHKDELTARVGLRESEIMRTNSDRLDSDHANVVDVFEYLIGNTDYSLIGGSAGEACCHNSILLTADDETFFPVPYDFDFSGLVDAPYAGPNPKLRIKDVTTRLYRGSCAHVDKIVGTVAMFMEKEADVLALVDVQEGLSERPRRQARRYLAEFYVDVDEPKEIERKLLRRCS